MCLGIPGQIEEVTDADRLLAMVNVGGVMREVSLSCIVEDAESLQRYVGEWVLVHVGFAMSVIDEEEAASTLKILEELGEAEEELAAMRASAPPGGRSVSTSS